MKKEFFSLFGFATLSATLLIGCADQSGSPTTSTGKTDSTYLASTEPTGALPVGEARGTSQDKQEVVLVGRIGGSSKPFIDGLAAFTIVDPKVPYCSEDEGCPTPWDYCCEQNQVKENIATVKVVNTEGKPVSEDARKLLGVKELNMVVVHGTAQRDDDGNLSVLADQIYVKE
ncbi:hypothetical protein [Rubinisphaera italica]|uniref:Uncharacterized protein n=1 Tax=Rubinisphaera italica TaxID=2527969 RepID=A0A5C5XEV7_9PLAN|nr:hypothetical protein [Rubinisphaera italica]TWT61308.1 hypothetical protein Pan54_20440 [Rubinisphaera italica]